MAQPISGNENFTSVVGNSSKQKRSLNSSIINTSEIVNNDLSSSTSDIILSDNISIKGDLTTEGHIIVPNSDGPPVVTTNSTTITSVFSSAESSDCAGFITSIGETTGGDQITLTFNKPFESAPNAIVTPYNEEALDAEFYVSTSVNDLIININNGGKNDPIFSYIVIG